MTRAATGPARRYARALLDVALETKSVEPARLREELNGVVALLRDNTALHAALTHPALGADRRLALVKAVFSGRTSALFLRLVELLATRGRLALLPGIAAAFEASWNAERGVLAAEAVSAVPLDAAQLGALAAALRRASGNEVELRTAVDAALLGGLVVTMGGRTFDGSVRSQLRLLRSRLTGGAS